MIADLIETLLKFYSLLLKSHFGNPHWFFYFFGISIFNIIKIFTKSRTSLSLCAFCFFLLSLYRIRTVAIKYIN